MKKEDPVFDVLTRAHFSDDVLQLWDHQSPESEAETNLLEMLVKLESLVDTYAMNGIPQSILIDSLKDFRYRTNRHNHEMGEVGLSKHDMHWLHDFLNFRLFDLGSLRYQIFPFDRTYIEREGMDSLPLTQDQKDRFQDGDIYLNIHIMKGADLSPIAIDASLRQAREFFSKYFPELNIKGFITRTWLIYSKMSYLLPSESNIVKFGHRFEIIQEAPIQYQILERVYGTQDLEAIAKMPKKTSLQRNILNNLENVGVSFGYIPF